MAVLIRGALDDGYVYSLVRMFPLILPPEVEEPKLSFDYLCFKQRARGVRHYKVMYGEG